MYKRYINLFLIALASMFISNCSSLVKSSQNAKSSVKPQQIISIAKAQIGKPYHYGGTSPKTGFDCSGLINFSYKKLGINVARTTAQLYRTSIPINRADLIKGDLVFFRINRRKISHVGLYLGNGKFIHAPSSGKKVNIANMNDRYWRTKFARGGRL